MFQYSDLTPLEDTASKDIACRPDLTSVHRPFSRAIRSGRRFARYRPMQQGKTLTVGSVKANTGGPIYRQFSMGYQ